MLSPHFKRFASSLQFKIPTVFVASFLLILVCIVVVFATIGRSLLEKQAYKQVLLSGEAIVSQLGQRVALAESLATAIANLGEGLPSDADLYKELVGHVLDYEGTEAFVAGGGLWPEPYKFDANVERRSFFWGRDAEGALRYYDDYNNPEGPGYHNEEWYVPARYLREGEVFWSKSYMDPYSYQPMVTVTVPMYRDNSFYGVSTVDLKLEGLHDFLDQVSRTFGGYAFAVDRNGKFLSFPDEKITKRYEIDAEGVRTEEFITAAQLANKASLFGPLSGALQRTIDDVIAFARDLPAFDPDLGKHIERDSYQIDDQEAELIAAVLAASQLNEELVVSEPRQLFIENDMLLNEPAFAAVFQMPGTFWKVVTVMPYSRAIVDSNLIYRNLIGAILVAMLVSLLMMMFVVRQILVSPIADMSRQLKALSEDEESSEQPLVLTDTGELGNLGYWFNQRSRKLFQVQSQLRQAQEELEQRVLERTEELRQQIEKRSREQEQREALAARVEKQHAAVVKLSLHESLFQGRVTEAAGLVAETMARVLCVARASIWLHDQNKACFRAVDLFDSNTGGHRAGDELAIGDYPTYFAALASHRSIAVYDMHQDERTRELRDYASAHGIVSLLDSPIRIGGELAGVVCFEHVGDRRKWHEDEIRFSGEIADQFVQVLAASERQRSEEQIRKLAFYDPLTELANRRLLQEELSHELEVARRRGVYGSLLFLDLDNFKTLNDSLGHKIGDELLAQVAQRLCATLRAEDTAARLGGDEFVVVLTGEHKSKHKAMEQALSVARKVRSEIGESYHLLGYEHVITASMGITIFPEDHESAADLLQQADAAMYRAKAEGRNTISFFDPAMQKQAEHRLLLEKQLRTGIIRKQFQTYLQVQVDASGSPVGAEALIRWNHPENGLVTPKHFIPTAEETGLILELGRISLIDACRFTRRYEIGRIAVNISPLQFRQPDFVETVTGILEQTGADPNSLMIEVTEGVVIERIRDTIDKMEALKEMGIKISIDDFGTGYSSLAYLKQLPLDQLKIGDEFVRDIITDPNDAVIVETIIAMAGHLGLEVVAEGVESQAQFDFLRKHGCSIFQGFHYATPLPDVQFEQYLSKAGNPI